MERGMDVRLDNRQQEQRRIRYFFGGLLAVLGSLDVIEPLIANHPVRSQVLDSLLPTDVTLGGRTGTVIAGLALLLLARGVTRGKRVAWQLTVVALLTSIPFHLLKDLDFEEAILAGWMLLGLWWIRDHFRAQSDPASVRRGVLVLVAVVFLALAYTVVGTWLLSSQLAPAVELRGTLDNLADALLQNQSVYRALSARGAWFLGSLPWVAYALVLFGLLQVLRPVLAPPVAAAERERLRRLVRRWGHNPVCHLALYGPTSHFWPDDETCIAYSVRGRTALALGDPICPPENLARAVQEFMLFCDRQDWIPAFYQVEDKQHYGDLGFRMVPIGSDAVVHTQSFSLEGKDRAALRYAVHRCERHEIRCEFLQAPDAWNTVRADLLEVSGSWLGRGRGPELGFSLGTLATLRDPSIMVGLAYDPAHRLQAFVSWLPVPGRNGWTLDLMRRRPDSPRGVMELLIVRSIEEASHRGIEEVSLGLAPLAITSSDSNRLADRALRNVYGRLDRFRRSRSLRQFKSKFAPVWEDRYLAVPTTAALPEVLVALLGAHLPAVSLLSLRLNAARRAGSDSRPCRGLGTG
ncbi:MAG: bifunctional lysylphosphatidylglycerol flippase/synthetase MprF [Isosphaeraceae bacterium]